MFAELTIRGSKDGLAQFVDALEARLTDGWARNRIIEEKIIRPAIGRIYCFGCTERGRRPAADLFLASHSDSRLHVSNILPKALPFLSHDQYNGILFEFCETFASPAAQETGVYLDLSDPNPQLEDFVSDHAADLLRNFSEAANRSFLHDNDRQRWNAFLAAAHREQSTLSAGMLKLWLVEEEHWPEEKAAELATEYEHARDLLQLYESQPA